MASSLILLRRSLRSLSGLYHSFSATTTSLSVPIRTSISSSCSRSESPNLGVQSRSFNSTTISLLSVRHSPTSNIPDEIGPDTILFEGCDYKHWLFVMDFPKDNKPSPEEMVRVYEETCAKGLNISLEEAKKKIYACSTTTYTGFQAVMTEEESNKFENLPGVIFILPDSYIDPVNKQYGGDQYIEGTIIPRPPPVQFGRNQGARRDYNRQDNSMPNNRGNPSYNNRGPMPRDGRNYGPSQNYPPPQHNYNQGPHSPQQLNHDQASQNYPPRQDYGQNSQRYPPQQNYGPPSQGYPSQQSHDQASPGFPPKQNFGPPSQNYSQPQNFNQAPPNYSQPQNYGPTSPQYAPQQSFGPPGQGERRNYAPPQNFGPPGQRERRGPAPSEGGQDFKPSYMEEFEQAEKGNFTGEGRY